jgi:hypothetical protein
VGVLTVLGELMTIEETLRKAEMIDPYLPYWIEKIIEVAGSESPHDILIAAAYLLSKQEKIQEDWERHGF